MFGSPGPSTAMYCRGGTTTSTESTLASTAAFVVDDGTGSVHVVPAALVEGATQVVSEFVEAPAGTRTLGYQRDEWILEEGVTVFVHAIAEDASGELRLSSPGRSGDMVISTRSEAEELNRLERLGLTFGRVQRGAVAFTIVCVLAIVALVVLT